ncbi:MAG TPA: winged helix-turn-helix domain-containing protein, partial [Casimicrobiaceae bacterium]|nr:winged helix-turn-helix domain-containing protein [Casimicrobiaceae bacterium]
MGAAPNVVTYDELMARVWAGLVVQPETISQRAKLLRDALEDDPQSPRFVRGVRGRGYVLACAVQRCEPEELATKPTEPLLATSPESTHASSLPSAVSSRRFDKPLVIAAIGLLAIVTAAATLVSLGDGSLTLAPSHVVAVAPFQAVTSEPRDAALARGIGDAVHARLISRKDLPAPGAELSPPLDTPLLARLAWPGGSHYLLKGALQRSNERLRITAQLFDTHNGELIHSFLLEADTRDALRLEDDIAQHAARAIHVESEARAAMQRREAGTRNPDARLAFERGRARYQRWRIDDGEIAIVHFKRSVALDPDYARAYVWQAMAEFRNAVLYKHQDAQLEMQAVRPLFERALALDPKLGEARAAPAFFDTRLEPEAA